MQQQPAWLGEAWRELGQREIGGNADNPRIMALYRDAGVHGIRHDETAWCAAFVGACLKRAGYAGTGSLLARSYLAWGAVPESGTLGHGAVVVLKRGADAAAGHVGFLVGETDSSVVLLGGNQSDSVTVAAFAREDVLGVRWPSPVATPLPREPATQAGAPGDVLFEAALAHELEMEGGWTDDPEDPGGPTNLGMTLADLAAWHGVALDAASRAILLDELRRLDIAAVRPIYRQRYWRASRAGDLPPGLALMHFDCAVNQGLGRAIRFLQEAVGASVDGEIGPQTLAAGARAEPDVALQTYAELRRAHYRGLATFARFGRGWLARVDKTLARARELPPTASDRSLSNSSKGETPMSTAEPNTPASTAPVVVADPKWWGQSMTVWGTLITAAATVLPALGPLIGIDLSAETIRQVGGQAAETVRAIAGLAGTIMAIYGRSRAAQPLMRRDISLRL